MENKKFVVYITETLTNAIYIESENEEKALEEVKEKYNNEEIVLDYGDFEDVNFIVEERKDNNKDDRKFKSL